MEIGVVSIFPDMFRAISEYGMTRQALETGAVSLEMFNPRDFTTDRHRAVDDRPYGGGPGMVMKPEPLSMSIDSATQSIDGPVYVRLGGRYPEVPVTAVDAKPTIGKADTLRDGNDVSVIACGCLVADAIGAADALAAEGIKVRVINMHTIKPLDCDAVLAAAAETCGIVTAEEHHFTGGLGGAVAELLAQERPTRMRFVGMPDEFAIVGPTPTVREHYGMSAQNIIAKCRELIELAD